MSFGHPAVLFLAVIPIALLVREWSGGGVAVVLPLDHAGAPRGRGWGTALRAARSLPPLLLLVGVLLAAGPRRSAEPREKRVVTNITVCLDVSGSMMAPFGEGTRYDAAMAALNDFVGKRKGDAFALTAFGSGVLHWVPLTSDPSAFRCAPPFLRPERMPYWIGGGTMIGLALTEAFKVLSAREEGDRMIILVSDGYSADLFGGKDAEIARTLKAGRTSVFGIHVAEGAPPAEIGTICSETGGAVFAAGEPAALAEVFARIDRMRPARLERSAPETVDDFLPSCLAGAVMLACSVFAHFGLRTTPW